MRFWDASALVPLFIAETGTAHAEGWLREDPHVVVWTLTRVELLSALARRRRQEHGTAGTVSAARTELLSTWGRWSEVAAIEPVRAQAERIVERHPLRAADALQLGAAIVAAAGDPATLEFVTFDARQADAAEHEGFRVLRQAAV